MQVRQESSTCDIFGPGLYCELASWAMTARLAESYGTVSCSIFPLPTLLYRRVSGGGSIAARPSVCAPLQDGAGVGGGLPRFALLDASHYFIPL